MKRWLAVFLLLTGSALAQTSAITATITDPDGQTWNNGTYTITLVPAPFAPGPSTWSGGTLVTQFTGTMNGSGVLTQSVADVLTISPPGAKWQFTLCPKASAPCQNVVVTVTGATPNLSAALSAALVAPRFNSGDFAFGYQDAEVVTPLQPGAVYYNVTNSVQRIWSGSAWGNGAGSGGTVSSVGLTLNSGATCGAGTVSGSPVTTSGTLNIAFVGVNGNIITFNSSGCPIDSGTLLSSLAPIANPTFTGTVSGITATMVGLGNVTNNTQTQAAIVPNTAPAAGAILVGNAGGTAYAQQAMTQDCTITSSGVITCLKTNNVAFTGLATAAIPLTVGNGGTGIATCVLNDVITGGGGASNFNCQNTMKIAAGLVTVYNNVTTAGQGVAAVLATVNQTAQTAAITTATLCAAATCGNGTASQYHVHWDFWGSGTACSSVTAGSVTFLLTWTDENAVTHSAVALQMMGQTGAATTAMGGTFPFQTALANEGASGDATISTNGTIIQYATGYTACTTGTGTYNLRISVTRLI